MKTMSRLRCGNVPEHVERRLVDDLDALLDAGAAEVCPRDARALACRDRSSRCGRPAEARAPSRASSIRTRCRSRGRGSPACSARAWTETVRTRGRRSECLRAGRAAPARAAAAAAPDGPASGRRDRARCAGLPPAASGNLPVPSGGGARVVEASGPPHDRSPLEASVGNARPTIVHAEEVRPCRLARHLGQHAAGPFRTVRGLRQEHQSAQRTDRRADLERATPPARTRTSPSSRAGSDSSTTAWCCTSTTSAT